MARRWIVGRGIGLALWLALCAPVVTLVIAGVTADSAQAQAIRSIEVEGNRRVEPETVRSYLQLNTGDAYDAGKADRSVKALFGTGLFADVSVDMSGSTLVVTVVENPVINEVAFEGNSEVDADTLRNEVQLKPRSVYTRAKVQADVQRILDVYQRQGRFTAHVEPQIIELEQNRVNLVFEITEGGATKIKGINFTGNHVFSDSQLRDIISTTPAGWFDFLKGTSVYDPDRLSLDRELLRQYYLKNGYADARVVSANAELDTDGTGFFVNFTIEEGEQYNFGAVTIESTMSGVNPAGLNDELLTEQGDLFNGQQIEKSVERLTLEVSEQGYAFARVKPRTIPDAASRTIAVTYIVEEGPRIYIERINVVGNTRTKDYVIRREFRLAEGDAYNPMMVDRAKKRLQALGLFKTAEVKRQPGSAEDRVVLDVVVEEQSTGELSFGAGYSTSEGVIGDISIAERNLFGNGQYLRLKLSGSIERWQVDLSFTEPRFLDQNIAFGFDLFHKDVNQSDEGGFSSRKTGGSLRLGFPLAENFWMQTYYSIDQTSLYDVNEDNVSKFVSEEIERNGDTTLTSLVGAAVSYDKRNHPKNPTSGYFLSLGADFAGLGGDTQYARFVGEGRAYLPVTEKITLVGRVIGGTISGWGGDDVSLTDLFYRGGETIRGFERGGFGPRDLKTDDAIGGLHYWAATAELRFPIPLIPEEIGISGAVFADAGSLWGTNDLARELDASGDINLVDESAIRSSIGASLLWNSPVGPLRVDYSHILSKEVYDKDEVLRFGAQTKF